MKTESIRSVIVATLALTSIATCSFLVGCKPSKEETVQKEVQGEQAIENVHQQIEALTSEKKWDEALKLIEKSLSDPTFEYYKDQLLQKKISIYLSADRLEDAKAAVKALLSDSPDTFYPCAQKIFSFEMDGENYRNALDWCKTFTGTDIETPKGVRESLLFDQLNVSMILKDEKEILLVLNSLPMDDSTVRSRLESSLIQQIRKGDPTFLSKLFNEMQKSAKDQSIANFYLMVLVRSETMRKDWGSTTRLIPLCISKLTDNELARTCRVIFSGMRKDKATAQLENAAKLVITQAKGKETAAGVAAQVWVDCGMRQNASLLPTRLDSLLEAKINPNKVGDLLDQYFYNHIEDHKLVTELSDRGEKLITLCSDTNTVNSLKVKVLDGAFIVEDYAKAVRMLEKGIPGKDKIWHAMSLPKVKAHLALQQKDPLKAIGYFREFMKVWKDQKQDEEFDPTTNIAHSKEWILARNALRIAKIYDTIPNVAEAKKARAEAKAYYVTAKEKAAKDPEALKLLNQEFAELQ